MNREQIREIMGENATEEQITNMLNLYHNSNKQVNEELNTYKSKISTYSDYEELKKYKEEVEKSKLTEEQRLEQLKKETNENLKQSKIILNTAKAKDILTGLDLDEELIATLVSEDFEKTVSNATKLKEKMENLRIETEKKTKEDLIQTPVTPTPSNIVDDGKMTLEKFMKLSIDEQNKFANENPTEFEDLK